MYRHYFLFSIIIYLCTSFKTFSQQIPYEFFDYKLKNLLFDCGENWENNTNFSSPRFREFLKENQKNDSLNIKTQIGLKNRSKALEIYGFLHFNYKINFFGYLYPRLVNDISEFERYSGIPMDINRGGFISGETDMSGIGYENKWVCLEIVRGRESIGAGENINLTMKYNSPAYDYFRLSSNYGKIKVNYLNGFLESNSDQINRYIVFKGLEWTNKKSLIIGFSETIIYSGYNRGLDFGYLNPISSHLEVELNNHLNVIGSEAANAVWQFHFDLFFRKKFRLSFNYLIDEFVLDQSELDWGKEHGNGYSSRFSYTPIKTDKIICTLFSSVISIGTPTLRHGNGTNNFIQRSKPLGWEYGSDARESSLGLNIFNRKNFISEFKIGKLSIGEESLIFRPYEEYKDYLKDDFPSGDVISSNIMYLKFEYWWLQNISGELILNLNDGNFEREESYFKVGIKVYFKNNLSL